VLRTRVEDLDAARVSGAVDHSFLNQRHDERAVVVVSRPLRTIEGRSGRRRQIGHRFTGRVLDLVNRHVERQIG
jgi:hypothetical protein